MTTSQSKVNRLDGSMIERRLIVASTSLTSFFSEYACAQRLDFFLSFSPHMFLRRGANHVLTS